MDQCGVPGCDRPRGDLDCCEEIHSKSRPGSRCYRPNDGVIDYVAIDLVTEGVRMIKLTWVEALIAVAKMLVRGVNVNEIWERLGFEFRYGSRQQAEALAIAEAIRASGVYVS